MISVNLASNEFYSYFYLMVVWATHRNYFRCIDPLCIWTKALTNTPHIQNRQSSCMKVLLGPKHKIWKGPFLDICTQLYSTFWMCFVHRYNYSWVDLTLPQICRFQLICKYLQVIFYSSVIHECRLEKILKTPKSVLTWK